jgi:hypothetical protein
MSARLLISADAVERLRRSLAPRSGTSLDQFLRDADRIRAEHVLPGDSPSAAELIREDRDR